MRPDEAERKYIELLSKLSGNERVKIGAELYETVRGIVASAVKDESPSYSYKEITEAVNQRMALCNKKK